MGEEAQFRGPEKRNGSGFLRLVASCLLNSSKGESVTRRPKKQKGQSEDWPKCLILLVGAAGFELATPCTPYWYFYFY